MWLDACRGLMFTPSIWCTNAQSLRSVCHLFARKGNAVWATEGDFIPLLHFFALAPSFLPLMPDGRGRGGGSKPSAESGIENVMPCCRARPTRRGGSYCFFDCSLVYCVCRAGFWVTAFFHGMLWDSSTPVYRVLRTCYVMYGIKSGKYR